MTTNVVRVPRREPARCALLEARLRRYHSGAQDAVRRLAQRHARIADLAVSFPALLFGLAVPRPGLDPAAALACVIEGRSLTDAAAAAEVPMWLRKLPPEAFMRPLPKLSDGELFRRQIGNHLPPTPKLAPVWLQSVAEVGALAHDAAAAWIAREFVRKPWRECPARIRLISLWAWFSVEPATFAHALIERRWVPEMRFDKALAAADDWRTMIDLHVNLGHQPIADIWLAPGRLASYDFHPLTSIAALAEEAGAMRNCVCTYGPSLAHNRSRLWSVKRDGARVATLKVGTAYGDPLPNIVELKGIGNSPVSADLWWAARRWLNMHDLPGIDMARRNWGTAPLDRDMWRSVWRPYWLAKQRIPDWLPLAPSRNALDKL